MLPAKRLPFTLAIGLAAFAIALAVITAPSVAEQALLAARWTARAALPIFLIAYVARPLHQLFASKMTKQLLAARRQWGLAYALAMALHLAALIVNILIFRPRDLASLAVGGAIYAVIFAMALSSNNAAMKRMGKGWKILHTSGLHLIWASFFVAYFLRALGYGQDEQVEGVIFSALLLIALAPRLIIGLRKFEVSRAKAR